MGVTWPVAWWWVKHRPIRLACLDGIGQGVVDLEDSFLCAVFAEGRLVFASHDRKGLQDVVHVVAFDPVEVEERGVQLRAEP